MVFDQTARNKEVNTTAELKQPLRLAIKRLRRKPAVIKASFPEAKLH